MSVPVQRNPMDSMKSSWRDRPEIWTRNHHLLGRFNPYGEDPEKPFPVHKKTDPIPVLTDWSANLWILAHALWPMVVHRAFTALTGWNLHPIGAFLLYTFALKFNAFRELWAIRIIAQKVGFLDGDKHVRDDIPDVGVDKAARALNMTTTVRPLLAVFLTYRSAAPVMFSKWVPVELFLYSIVLDFFFYTYHRSCHEVEWLWKYHRTHHLTKHPNPLLSAYADTEQEVIEIALVPLLTFASLRLMGLPMNFYDWWLCHEFVLFSEAIGHSGLRISSTPPGLSTWVLSLIGAELTIEDHDLHHRQGWKKSQNYGKQTRLWDLIFGTCGERIEGKAENIDYNNKINMPLYNQDALAILFGNKAKTSGKAS
ncbi:hypothetical protein AMS68_000111 [Peltaster fructicola]|uniref:Fatty acid hydroxylase domain-containing protein n=1 Tax=Peltaster fructicola TaxID=286661 RepID=A0A6H0XIQ6_9PEZI|nr:hypothetical protein AMS68_000111 [Peltaster fructicola]